MKNIHVIRVVLIFFSYTIATVSSTADEKGTCYVNPCWSSSECARDADDFSCRCVALHCGLMQNKCGGGCITDAQCAEWADGDRSCVCGYLFECENKYEMERPGYQTYTKLMAALQGDKLKKKVAILYKESLAKEEQKKRN